MYRSYPVDPMFPENGLSVFSCNGILESNGLSDDRLASAYVVSPWCTSSKLAI